MRRHTKVTEIQYGDQKTENELHTVGQQGRAVGEDHLVFLEITREH